ncbi:hypothetical protein LPJ38_10155 [Bradyrhizobium daqingense]|uniref:hypothetical protein n=1 Tax=Bradyrhizobium daqingense TaxID=993502 RepID=UPI0011A0A745|nr:hypothetical protein [Bradyrhizobium daqingense]UFS91062.1 hypothetical protein LPJ38_10155 [Bradyrhizobium daqingense]
MADAPGAAFSFENAAPFAWKTFSPRPIRMAFELLLIAQMIRRPAQALARRWYCRSLVRASRGRFRCAGCNAS